jgi:hypothetical protein
MLCTESERDVERCREGGCSSGITGRASPFETSTLPTVAVWPVLFYAALANHRFSSESDHSEATHVDAPNVSAEELSRLTDDDSGPCATTRNEGSISDAQVPLCD